MTDWNNYKSIMERYNDLFDKAIKRLQKRCKHKDLILGTNKGKECFYCSNCIKIIKKRAEAGA